MNFFRKFRPILFFLLLCILAPVLHSQSTVYLKIQSQGFQPIRILVSQFNANIPTDVSQKVRDVIINDLNLSGFFYVIDETELDASYSDTSTTIFKNEIRAAAQLQARLTIQQDLLLLTVRLSDLAAASMVFEEQFRGKISTLRWMAHEVADKVVYYLVGEEGVATTQLAFVRDNRTTKEIALIDYDGENYAQITSENTISLSPCWASSGKALAFTTYVLNNPDLVILDLRDNRLLKLSRQKGLNTAPAWSPDQKKIALTLSKDGNAEIYTKELATGKLIRLTNHPAIDSSPTWSPNGREMAFTSDRSGSPQVYIMDAEGSNVRRLTFRGSYNDSPEWSPKGDLIAYVSRIDGYFQVCTVDVNGENVKQITQSNGNNENPSWSPDGFRLAFASNRNGNWQIYIMNLDGSQLRQVTQEGSNIAPAWSPRLKRNLD